MQQVRRILISVLAIAALAVGATVASADRGGDMHKGHRGRAPRSACSPSSSRIPPPIPRGSRSTSARAPSSSASRPAATSTAARSAATPSCRSSTPRPARPRSASRSTAASSTSPAARPGRSRSTTSPPRQQVGDVRDARHGRLPQRPRRHATRRRLRHGLPPADAVARDRRAGRGRHGRAAGARRQRDPLRGRPVQPQRDRHQGRAQARRGELLQRQAVPDQARRRRRVDRGDRRDRGRHRARRRRPAARPRPPRGRAGRPAPSCRSSSSAAARAAPRSRARRRATSSRGPSTVDATKRLYLVVNADFDNDETPFTVAGLPRKSKRGHDRGKDHGHGHDRGRDKDDDHGRGDDDRG